MKAKVGHCAGRGRRAGRGIDAIIGVSDWARRIRAEILRVAGYDSNVLITGLSGTGKELIARALCSYGARADGPLVPVDCAALPGELFMSQMFGHLKGAFTGAHYTAIGAFRAAEGGTIFLDEIGELDHALQAKLLRVIQEKCVVPLGSHNGEPVDVRIIAATNRDLEADVRTHRFRDDLYYRLNVISLRTEPLKDHPADIEPLANYFLHKLAIHAGLPLKRLSRGAINLLLSYDWPGNVRELDNHLERAAIYTEGEILRAESMPELLEAVMAGPQPLGSPRDGPAESHHAEPEDYTSCVEPRQRAATGDQYDWPTMAEVERRHILYTLEHTLFNQCAAARILEMDRHALRRKIKKYGLDVSQSRRGRPVGCRSSRLPR